MELGCGKSPGPDGIPAELYRRFVDLVAPELTKVLRESAQDSRLPPSFLEGDITLIYKKKDPRDIHPVTSIVHKTMPAGMRRAFWDRLVPVPAPFTLNGTHQDYTDCSTHRHD